MRTKAATATTSHAITLIPSLNAEPFKPTICSVERFVNNNEPAITGYVKLLPARKKPSCDAVSRFRTMSQVPNATKAVKKRNEIIVIANMIGSFRCNKYIDPLYSITCKSIFQCENDFFYYFEYLLFYVIIP